LYIFFLSAKPGKSHLPGYQGVALEVCSGSPECPEYRIFMAFAAMGLSHRIAFDKLGLICHTSQNINLNTVVNP